MNASLAYGKAPSPPKKIMVYEKVDFEVAMLPWKVSIRTSILLLIHGGLLAHTAPEASLKQKRNLYIFCGGFWPGFCSACNKNEFYFTPSFPKDVLRKVARSCCWFDVIGQASWTSPPRRLFYEGRCYKDSFLYCVHLCTA